MDVVYCSRVQVEVFPFVVLTGILEPPESSDPQILRLAHASYERYRGRRSVRVSHLNVKIIEEFDRMVLANVGLLPTHR